MSQVFEKFEDKQNLLPPAHSRLCMGQILNMAEMQAVTLVCGEWQGVPCPKGWEQKKVWPFVWNKS
jgi:hypothetical protein